MWRAVRDAMYLQLGNIFFMPVAAGAAVLCEETMELNISREFTNLWLW